MSITGFYRDDLTDSLYAVRGAGVVAMHRGPVQTAVWRSRAYVYPAPVTFSWIKVRGVLASGATVKLYADGALAQTLTVNSREPHRVRPTRGRRWEVEVVSTDRITGVDLAQASEELP